MGKIEDLTFMPRNKDKVLDRTWHIARAALFTMHKVPTNTPDTNDRRMKGARMSYKCHYCGGNAELIGKNWDNEDVFRCKKCGKQGRDDRFSDRPTVFHRITASPEVLAVTLVYRYDGNGTWRSFLLYGYEFLTKEEAYAATVARLIEVEE